MADQTVAEVMTPAVSSVPSTASVAEAARRMRDDGIGDVLVVDDDRLRGIVTDRDLVVRVLAEHRDPETCPVGDVASARIVVVSPTDSAEKAVHLMRRSAIRRLPVVDEGGHPVGMLSLGDLAVHRDPRSALADISATPPND